MRHPWLLLPRLRFTPGLSACGFDIESIALPCRPPLFISCCKQSPRSWPESPSDSLNDNVSFAHSQVERHDPPTHASKPPCGEPVRAKEFTKMPVVSRLQCADCCLVNKTMLHQHPLSSRPPCTTAFYSSLAYSSRTSSAGLQTVRAFGRVLAHDRNSPTRPKKQAHEITILLHD
jgi:hypothetical protein